MLDDYHCENCNRSFDNGFEFVEHFMEEECDDVFDPYLILPNGVKLQVGSLLRFIYDHAEHPEQIRKISESTYVTLFAAENQVEEVEAMIKEMVVSSEMLKFDDSLKTLLEQADPDDIEGEQDDD
jgi:hypothetical protein